MNLKRYIDAAVRREVRKAFRDGMFDPLYRLYAFAKKTKEQIRLLMILLNILRIMPHTFQESKILILF